MLCSSKRATKTFKGKVYKSYALTESYREDGKVKHCNILNLGPLSEEQAQRIRLILKVTQNEDLFVGKLSDIVAKTHYRFLDVALLHYFWQYWGLGNFFADLPLAEVMSINRCLDPKSKFQVNAWAFETVLPRLLPLDPENDEYAIYRALDRIATMEGELQSFLYRKLQAISEEKFNYVSTISRDEISGLNILDPDLALRLNLGNWRQELSKAGFIPYDQNLLYREHRLGDRRYILAFNPELFLEQQETYQQHYHKAEEFIARLNAELHQAKKSRDPEKIQKQIDVRLKKLKMHKVFIFQLIPVNLSRTTKSGKEKTVQSFKIEYQIDQEALNRQNWQNGFLCFVTNQPAEKLTPVEVISYYRHKNKIEEAFREIKHYLKLRPVFVTRKKRVNAHVAICVLGYLLLTSLTKN